MSEAQRSSLADAASPFLRHGAAQPVAWEAWGEAAFERARREDRPILLDIGAVWCHWCHVMDRESYEDPETATLINARFVAVKVDRDERPDVDARYQRAVQGLAGQGGWPLTVFLTPDGDAFHGGTYFPPVDAHGRPSFRRVLNEVLRVWQDERERVHDSAGGLRRRLEESEASLRRPAALSPALVATGVEALAEEFDFRHGGFGRAPKFPSPGGLHLLLDRWLDGGEAWMRRVVEETLVAMGQGGICDQLGGGFHRYSTDARWLIPHFEKMAGDNGALLEVYARAAGVLDEAPLRSVAEGIVRYYAETAPELLEVGGFPASQDADVGPDDDGDYWTWTPQEIAAALGGDVRSIHAARLRYGLDDDGARMHGSDRHVLFLARSPEAVATGMGESDEAAADVAALLDAAARRLAEARGRRRRPFVDPTVYADRTAQLASGHFAAARHAGASTAADVGLRALERIWAEGWRSGRGVVHRIAGPPNGEAPSGAPAFLSDQAFTVQAMLDALELTQDAGWLARARAVADVIIGRFAAPDGAGFLDRPGDEPGVGALTQRHRPIADSPEPSGNAAAALALLRLHAHTGEEEDYGGAARRALTAFAGAAARMGSGAATYFRAVDWAVGPVTSVVVVGENADAATDPIFQEALKRYRPRTVLRRFVADAVDLSALPAAQRAMVTGAAPRAYVCAGQTCAAPVAKPAELRALLREFRG